MALDELARLRTAPTPPGLGTVAVKSDRGNLLTIKLLESDVQQQTKSVADLKDELIEAAEHEGQIQFPIPAWEQP